MSAFSWLSHYLLFALSAAPRCVLLCVIVLVVGCGPQSWWWAQHCAQGTFCPHSVSMCAHWATLYSDIGIGNGTLIPIVLWYKLCSEDLPFPLHKKCKYTSCKQKLLMLTVKFMQCWLVKYCGCHVGCYHKSGPTLLPRSRLLVTSISIRATGSWIA